MSKPKAKTVKTKETKDQASTSDFSMLEKIDSPTDLTTYLRGLLDKMTDESASAIFALSAIRYCLSLPKIYEMLNKENKELARDIWLRIKQAGLHVANPPALFDKDEQVAVR